MIVELLDKKLQNQHEKQLSNNNLGDLIRITIETGKWKGRGCC